MPSDISELVNKNCNHKLFNIRKENNTEISTLFLKPIFNSKKNNIDK